VITFNCVSHQ